MPQFSDANTAVAAGGLAVASCYNDRHVQEAVSQGDQWAVRSVFAACGGDGPTEEQKENFFLTADAGCGIVSQWRKRAVRKRPSPPLAGSSNPRFRSRPVDAFLGSGFGTLPSASDPPLGANTSVLNLGRGGPDFGVQLGYGSAPTGTGAPTSSAPTRTSTVGRPWRIPRRGHRLEPDRVPYAGSGPPRRCSVDGTVGAGNAPANMIDGGTRRRHRTTSRWPSRTATFAPRRSATASSTSSGWRRPKCTRLRLRLLDRVHRRHGAELGIDEGTGQPARPAARP
jgi:hypothetical protein